MNHLLTNLNIRWLIRRDLDEVLSIEERSFQFPWTEEEFLICLRERNTIGCVAEQDSQIVGFMIYELHKSTLRLLNLAVHPRFRRQGVGAALVQRLVDKMSSQRRRFIDCTVRDGNLPAQLFFSSQKFRAVDVLHDYFEDTSEDAYLMRYEWTGSDA